MDDLDDYTALDIDLEDFIEEENKDAIQIERKEKITLPIMNIYEKARIISTRVHQLNNGYKSFIPEEIKKRNLTSSFEIAMLEFDMKKFPPFKVKRQFPDGSYESWTMEEFKYFP
jgi:DNA-directed RNA polymerase subunit K/omega